MYFAKKGNSTYDRVSARDNSTSLNDSSTMVNSVSKKGSAQNVGSNRLYTRNALPRRRKRNYTEEEDYFTS